jgi:hypothetical protein
LASRSQVVLSPGATAAICPDLHAAAKVVALERGVGLAPQRGGGLRHLAGLGLIWAQLDRRVGEIVALERLVGGNRGNGQQQDERGCGSANERDHGGPPGSRPAGKSERGAAAR